ncbi:hypothetical protein N7931_17870 [Catenovulum sp. 2E275]|nr:hypothetical protein [Catenovulum sp. 2E275]MCU4677494.1 hypothetical protein [Catenovulum sp. 2E275]
MSINLWGFLSICVIFGISIAMFAMYLNHKKEMKQLEIEQLKLNSNKPV